MSQDKLEINHTVNTSTEENEVEGQTKTNKKEEERLISRSIITASKSIYSEEMLLNHIDKTGLLDDYISGKKVTERSTLWIECFTRDDLIQIFTKFPRVYERCLFLMNSTLGPAVSSVLLFNDVFCSLFENVLQKAKDIHLRYGWSFAEGTDAFHEFELAISLLYTFLEEDAQAASSKEQRLSYALNKFAESEFVHLDDTGLAPIHTQLQHISQYGHCSAGFSEQLSRIYTAMTLVRTVLFYGNVLQEQWTETIGGEQRNDPKLWDYHQSAVFFKMKPELKKEMEAPLYHGSIDTEAAKRLLRTSGDYLARYSSNYKKHYFTILLDASFGHNKMVLNLIIPPAKLDAWIKNPMKYREEIELFIKEQLSMEQPEKIQSIINIFFKKEQYSPVFNPVCTLETTNSLLGVG
jgi:hypothetical protein